MTRDKADDTSLGHSLQGAGGLPGKRARLLTGEPGKSQPTSSAPATSKAGCRGWQSPHRAHPRPVEQMRLIARHGFRNAICSRRDGTGVLADCAAISYPRLCPPDFELRADAAFLPRKSRRMTGCGGKWRATTLKPARKNAETYPVDEDEGVNFASSG